MDGQMTFEFNQRPTIKGFPELRWTGKRPYRSTQYYPAQLRERYGEEKDNWINKIFWGDNLQVMSHLLKEYRGKIDLIYIDPPFDSKADYKKKIEVKGVGKAETDSTSFEEKQYGDIWTNDEYLQFMYERLIILRELLSDTGTIYLHCDWHKAHHLRMIMDEVFGPDKFVNEVIWHYSGAGTPKGCWAKRHDNLFVYSRTSDYCFNADEVRTEYAAATVERFSHAINNVRNGINFGSQTLNPLGKYPEDVLDVSIEAPSASVRTGYPTQKPEALLEKIIKASSNPGDLVFDCFMGSGTTQAVAMKLGRRFIGADINLGSIQTTTKRLISIAEEIGEEQGKYTSFEIYNVNNYDFFRNPIEAKNLLIEALEIQPFSQSDIWDGELDGRMVKIMPVNRIATKADLESLKANLPYKTYEKRKEENPTQPVERITIVCMGHEPDLKASLEAELSEYKLDIQIVDILRDKADLQLKREAEAEVVREGGKLVICAFYPMNLMQKLSLQKEYVEDWRQLVESIMIDWNYDGVVMQPAVTDVPDKKEMVVGVYDIPENAGTIKIKITDLLSESLELEV
ncbi:site-specific DNA-methyltransferase [Blautia sp. HCP3S3_C12]|uniref:site-specific DNA-methyltransferase n=1 Tax=unclassified Blautia TaxID=2648079 RepID=UPI003F89CFEF